MRLSIFPRTNLPTLATLTELEQRALTELNACDGEEALRAWHTRYFGDHGEMKQALKQVSTVPKEERPTYGKEANRVKQVLESAYETVLAREKEKALARSL